MEFRIFLLVLQRSLIQRDNLLGFRNTHAFQDNNIVLNISHTVHWDQLHNHFQHTVILQTIYSIEMKIILV